MIVGVAISYIIVMYHLLFISSATSVVNIDFHLYEKEIQNLIANQHQFTLYESVT